MDSRSSFHSNALLHWRAGRQVKPRHRTMSKEVCETIHLQLGDHSCDRGGSVHVLGLTSQISVEQHHTVSHRKEEKRKRKYHKESKFSMLSLVQIHHQKKEISSHLISKEKVQIKSKKFCGTVFHCQYCTYNTASQMFDIIKQIK